MTAYIFICAVKNLLTESHCRKSYLNEIYYSAANLIAWKVYDFTSHEAYLMSEQCRYRCHGYCAYQVRADCFSEAAVFASSIWKTNQPPGWKDR